MSDWIVTVKDEKFGYTFTAVFAAETSDDAVRIYNECYPGGSDTIISVTEGHLCDVMTKERFEELANCTVTENQYNGIKQVSTYYDRMFSDESSIVLFYHTFGMEGIDRMICHISGFEKVKESLREEVKSEHQRYLDCFVNYKKLYAYVLTVLGTLSDLFKKHKHKFDAFSVIVSYLDEEAKKIESEDYSL